MSNQSSLNSVLQTRIGIWLGAVIFLASLLNGAPYLLKTIGVLNSDQYDAYWMVHCDVDMIDGHSFIKRCDPEKGKLYGNVDEEYLLQARRYKHSLYEVGGWEIIFKLIKDFVFFLLISISLYLMAAGVVSPLSIRNLWPALPLLVMLIVAAVLTIHKYQNLLLVAAGIRPFLFLVIAVRTVC